VPRHVLTNEGSLIKLIVPLTNVSVISEVAARIVVVVVLIVVVATGADERGQQEQTERRVDLHFTSVCYQRMLGSQFSGLI